MGLLSHVASDDISGRGTQLRHFLIGVSSATPDWPLADALNFQTPKRPLLGVKMYLGLATRDLNNTKLTRFEKVLYYNKYTF